MGIDKTGQCDGIKPVNQWLVQDSSREVVFAVEGECFSSTCQRGVAQGLKSQPRLDKQRLQPQVTP